ncbi:hypothetical protein ACFP56_19375 [Paenibacillus septentrionalis]|uniref:Uncharacterized protein n=1 Tax=Paenibacillus septentrionalis TaxID=429342 RepID=A0ABW1V833_9BACL
MKQHQVPSYLHELFGEKQSSGVMIMIFLFGGVLTALLYVVFPEMTSALPVWRSVLALLLIFDVFCGCIANFTASTSNFYATRKRTRLIFISVHIHVILIALLLSNDIVHALIVWAYTIASAFIVNALIGRQSQLVTAGLLLSIGLGCMPMLPDIPPYMLIISSLFMLKVMFSFAVDHYNQARQQLR